MEVEIEPGKYVVAVSGGVDSVVLLDLLTTYYPLLTTAQTQYEFVVAHFDHGIREDSEQDRIFVQELAKKYGLKFEYEKEELGVDASEELARAHRYKFLNSALKKHKAKAIITAHHKDDLLETAIFNLLRGTSRSGLSSLKSTDKLARPLLDYKKSEILDYAKAHNLQWREDPTNQLLKYTRNKIRKFLSTLSSVEIKQLLQIINQSSAQNLEIDDLVAGIFDHGYNEYQCSFDRDFFISLPHKIAKEIVVHWLGILGANYDKKHIEKLTINLKTQKNGTKADVNKKYFFELSAKQISVKNRTSV